MTRQFLGLDPEFAFNGTFLYSYNAVDANLSSKIVLSSPGAVDTNAVTRLQYKASNDTYPNGRGDYTSGPWTGTVVRDQLVFKYRMKMDPSEIYSYPTWENQKHKGDRSQYYTMGVTLFLVKASVFSAGFVPNPNALRTHPSAVAWRSDFKDDVGSYDEYFDHFFPNSENNGWVRGPRSDQLEPNTKYWALLLPTVLKPAEFAQNPLLDRPWGGIYNTDNIGRAISFWTNRPPKKPKITSPVSGSLVPPNSEFDLTYTPDDSDKFVGSGPYPWSFPDIAGVQAQYAARPTQENPSPQWFDLPFGNAQGNGLTPGWAFHYSPVTPGGSGGSKLFLDNYTSKVRAGSNAVVANRGSLPAGDWQIRVRTFDWGHPQSTEVQPLGINRDRATLTPDQYPAFNTSEWSDPVNISVSAQVPPPIPISPVSSIAIVKGAPVRLTWQYRNTALPPFPQARRSVQIRKVSEPTWTTLVSGNGTDAFVDIDPASYSLDDPAEYEWRVQTEDSDNKVSNYSAVARFWIVAAPNSGEVRPLPVGTIDGARLGSGRYRVFVFRRGGQTRVAEITGITHLDFSRVRDDISTARVVIKGWDIDSGRLLANLQTWAYEVVIFRNGGFGYERVWEGPITLLTFKRDEVEIDAKDVMVYAYRRIIRQVMNDSRAGTSVTDRAARVLQNTMAPDDPNVLAYLQILAREDDAKQYRSTPAYSRTAFEEVDDMAANSGLDYTVVGRAILLWGTRHRIGTLPEFKDIHLGEAPIVSEYGMSMSNHYSVSDGNGAHGEASRLNEFGFDPIYGLVEMLSSSWASDSPQDSGTYTQSGLEKVIQSFKGFAERSIADRYPPPVIVRVPDNTTLSPETPISFQNLVPGVAIPLRSTSTLRFVSKTQKLDSVKVTVEKGDEQINVTMSPFGSDDAQTGVGEEQ